MLCDLSILAHNPQPTAPSWLWQTLGKGIKTFIGMAALSFYTSLPALSQEQLQCFFNRESEGVGVQELFLKGAVAEDAPYTYTVGSTINGQGDYDILLTKYHKTDEVWSVTWSGGGGGDDYGAGLSIDSNGNILVVGTSYVAAPLDYDAVILKYNSSGSLLWLNTYDHTGLPEGFVSVEVDGSDNVYACGGRTSTTLSDYLVVKYHASGTELWSAAYDHALLEDVAVRMVVSGNSVRVSGGTQTGASNWLMTTIALNASTGALTTTHSAGGGSSGMDRVTDLATDGTDTYVIGEVLNSSGYDWKLVKLNDSLQVEWQDTFDLDGLNDGAKSIIVNSGDVYVTGYGTRQGEGQNILTRKYSSSGVLSWTSEVHLEADDSPEVIRIADDNQLIIAGSSYHQSNTDVVLLKLDESTGNLIWSVTHNGPNNEDDVPYGLVQQDDGELLVAANTGIGEGSSSYTLMQFDERLVSVPQLPTQLNGLGYLTNKGQLLNSSNAAATQVMFYNQSHFPSTYLGNKIISYQLSELTSDSSANYHRVDMQFLKGHAAPENYAYGEQKEFLNFYLAHLPGKSERTPHHTAVVRTGQYDHTDIVFTSQPEGYRHWIVARPGAPSSDFQMAYEGQDSLSISSGGDLLISTSQGDIVQKAPKAYTMNTVTGAMTELSWQPAYTLVNATTLGFTFPGTWSGTLVIELDQSTSLAPTATTIGNLDWSTFVGGTGKEVFYGSDATSNENVWVAGEIAAELFAEVTEETNVVGNFVGQTEMVAARFDENCELKFVTIYGGSAIDMAFGVAVDEEDRSLVVGWTQSSNMPDVEGGLVDFSVIGGAADAYLLELNGNGFVELDSYLGGAGTDVAYAVAYHNNTQIGEGEHQFWIAGYSNNGNGFPTIASDGYQQAFGGGNDGFLLRLSGTEELEITYQSFFGGDSDELIFDIAMVDDAPVFCGTTNATAYSSSTCAAPSDGGFPNCASGSQYSLSPETDYFLARLEPSTMDLKWSTAVSGVVGPVSFTKQRPTVSANSSGYGWENPKRIVLAVTAEGPTESSFSLVQPTNPNAFFQNEITDVSHEIYLGMWSVAGLNQNHTQIWGTFVGSAARDVAFDVSMDRFNQVFVTGTTFSNYAAVEWEWCDVPSGGEFPLCNETTFNYMETQPNNPPLSSQRTFIMSFDSEFEMRWSTFFGSAPLNIGHSLSIGSDKLFLTGATEAAWTLYEFNPNSSTDYWQPYYGDNIEATIARFDIPTIVSVNEHDWGQSIGIRLYPNPNHTGRLFMDIGRVDFRDASVSIYAMDGRKVMHLEAVQDIFTNGLDVRSLPPGSYLLSMQSKTQVQSGLFVVK